MKTSYKITALGGQYLREGMRVASTRDAAVATLREAMGYLGYPDAAIEHIDGGDIYAYADAQVAESGAEDPSVHPVLIATEVRP